MKMRSDPLVYVGPSLPRAEVERLLPGCTVRPPVRRGDLYQDRLMRGTVFVILDGVFQQELAVSVREVVDVIQDGALVVGASSMGALRAAECWPCGMRGVGVIYRLFRAGILESDDEVAVAFDAADAASKSTVPLINIRATLRAATRSSLINPEVSERALEQARGLFYTERTWPRLLRSLDLEQVAEPLLELAAGCDLKRQDACRALDRVRRWLQKTPELAQRPRPKLAFIPTESMRERVHDARRGLPEEELMEPLWRFLKLSGRVQTLMPGIQPAPAPVELWRALAAAGNLDGELFRWHAHLLAHDRGVASGVIPGEAELYQAELMLAVQNGHPSWQELEQRERASPLWSQLLGFRNELALVLAVRAREMAPVGRRMDQETGC